MHALIGLTKEFGYSRDRYGNIVFDAACAFMALRFWHAFAQSPESGALCL